MSGWYIPRINSDPCKMGQRFSACIPSYTDKRGEVAKRCGSPAGWLCFRRSHNFPVGEKAEGRNKPRRRVGLRRIIGFAAKVGEPYCISAHWYTYKCVRTCTVSSKAGLYLKVGWPGRPPAEMPATHWEETPSMLLGKVEV
jgi:hypothetical protein